MKFMINVPKDVLASLDWQPGLELECHNDGDVLWFKKKELDK